MFDYRSMQFAFWSYLLFHLAFWAYDSSSQISSNFLLLCILLREKEGDLTQSYDKSPYTDRKTKKATCQHKNATKNFDYTQLRTDLGRSVGGNDSHPIGVVKPAYGIPTFPLTGRAGIFQFLVFSSIYNKALLALQNCSFVLAR